jgi:hypothetical protein
MTNKKEAARLSRLRGSLPSEELGARGLEHMARNPSCSRLKALTILGVSPTTAASDVYADPVREGQSPFALAAGTRFERELFDRGAARLLELYRSRGRLTIEESKVVIIPDLAPNITPAGMAIRRRETMRLLRMKLGGNAMAPNVIVKPRLVVTLLGVEYAIEPDALVAADDERFYRVVEAKSYADRAGKTDPADIRGACRQAAVGVIGLRQFLTGVRVVESDQIVPAMGDLVFAIPGSFRPTLREMPLRGEVESLERALREAPKDLDELEDFLAEIGVGASVETPDILGLIPNNYLETCREHCALAQRCKRQALASGAPILLGSGAREELAAAGSINRALDLLRDQDASPRTPEEATLKAQLRLAYKEYRRAVS